MFPWDLHWENKTYKLKRSIGSSENQNPFELRHCFYNLDC